jgi:uncharacterized protein (TIGR00369 family)
MQIDELGSGTCRIVVPFRPEFVGDPQRPALHGGVMSTLADAAGGLAVFSTFGDFETRVSTVDLRIDYLRRGVLEDLTCDAEVIRVGNRVAVTSMSVTQQAGTRVVAEARAVYNIVRSGD